MEKKEPKQFVILGMACEKHTQSKQRTFSVARWRKPIKNIQKEKKKQKRKQNDASAYAVRIC